MARALLLRIAQHFTNFRDLSPLPSPSLRVGAVSPAAPTLSARTEMRSAIEVITKCWPFEKEFSSMHSVFSGSDPIFTETDYLIAREVIRDISDRDFKIVYLRFWENYSILEIAALLGMSWRAVDRRLECAMRLIKEKCLSAPGFSRNSYDSSIDLLLAAL